MYWTREMFLKCHSPHNVMRMNSHSKPQTSHVNRNPKDDLIFAHIHVLDTLYIPVHIILFYIF